MKKKVVLLSTGNDYPRYEGHIPVFPPVGILAVGSYLAAHAVPVELIDVQMDIGFGMTSAVERTVCERAARHLRNQADSVAWVGVSQLSNASSAAVLAQEIRAALPDTPIIYGGYFPSCNYEFLLRKYPSITAVVRGDGEAAALQISRSLEGAGSFLDDRTPNLAWLGEDGIRTTRVQPMDLKDLPTLDYRLLRNRSCYQAGSLMTSRGCPFRCNYCQEHGMRPYTVYPADWVARQLGHMEAELRCSRAVLADPIFGVGGDRTREMCRVMSEHRFAFAVESRVDVLSPDLLPLLRQAGIETIFLGIESASPSTLVRMNKVRTAPEAERYLHSAREVLRACFENNIVPSLGLMLGFPGDTEADLRATLEFVKEVDQLHGRVIAGTGVETGFISFSQPTQVYDGTPLADRLEKDFQVVLGTDSYDGERTVLSPSPGLSMDTVHRYEEEINNLGRYSARVEELAGYYTAFYPRDFAAAHPELTDEQGVTVLCESVQRLSGADWA
jgi:hypothetical protein